MSIINIFDKEDCCGCEACLDVCPQRCITLLEDKEGFAYPNIDITSCNNCSLCEKVCPVINQSDEIQALSIYGAKSLDEDIRATSSSGGIFTLLAERVIDNQGVVFGARFDEDWNVIHSYTETKEGLASFRGSKYVQSTIGESYSKAKEFLKSGRQVLFSGTPCQIAGLRLLLRKEYQNLICIDFICYGVPSPMVWRYYKNELIEETIRKKNTERTTKSYFTAINFRDKRIGWKKYGFSATINISSEQINVFIPHSESAYMKGFLSSLYLRPSCHSCPAKSFKSGSDITIADFWAIERELPRFDDDKGVSLVIVNNSKGDNLYKTICCHSEKVSSYALQERLFKSVKQNNKRALFFKRINEVSSVSSLIDELTHKGFVERIKIFVMSKAWIIIIPLIKKLKYER